MQLSDLVGNQTRYMEESIRNIPREDQLISKYKSSAKYVGLNFQISYSSFLFYILFKISGKLGFDTPVKRTKLYKCQLMSRCNWGKESLQFW